MNSKDLGGSNIFLLGKNYIFQVRKLHFATGKNEYFPSNKMNIFLLRKNYIFPEKGNIFLSRKREISSNFHISGLWGPRK